MIETRFALFRFISAGYWVCLGRYHLISRLARHPLDQSEAIFSLSRSLIGRENLTSGFVWEDISIFVIQVLYREGWIIVYKIIYLKPKIKIWELWEDLSKTWEYIGGFIGIMGNYWNYGKVWAPWVRWEKRKTILRYNFWIFNALFGFCRLENWPARFLPLLCVCARYRRYPRYPVCQPLPKHQS